MFGTFHYFLGTPVISCKHNYHGICTLGSSHNNTPHHNNLIDNTQNAYDTGTDPDIETF